jgi:hypothetical protein
MNKAVENGGRCIYPPSARKGNVMAKRRRLKIVVRNDVKPYRPIVWKSPTIANGWYANQRSCADYPVLFQVIKGGKHAA